VDIRNFDFSHEVRLARSTLSVGPVQVADGTRLAVVVSPHVYLGVEQVRYSDHHRRDPDYDNDCHHEARSHSWLQRMNDRHVSASAAPAASSVAEASTSMHYTFHYDCNIHTNNIIYY